jgi:hypothetical protein
MRKIHSKSMLHIQVLMEFDKLSRISKGVIVEIGAYVGGSTLALSTNPDKRVFTFEKGGSYSEHPHLPSTDILQDLYSNIQDFNRNNVFVIPHSTDDHIAMKDFATKIGNERIGLLVVDADGHVAKTISLFSPYLLEGARVVIDDYLVVSGHLKTTITHKEVNELIAEGVLIPKKVIGWGTWIGEMARN